MGTIVSLVSLVSRNEGTTGTSPEYRANKGIKEYIPGAREHGRAYREIWCYSFRSSRLMMCEATWVLGFPVERDSRNEPKL